MKFMGFYGNSLAKYAILMKPGSIFIINTEGVTKTDLYMFLLFSQLEYNFYHSWSNLRDRVYLTSMIVDSYLTV